MPVLSGPRGARGRCGKPLRPSNGFRGPALRPSATPVGAPAKRRRSSAHYRIEILPLWAPWAPAVSPLGGGVPGMNGAFTAYAGGRA